MKIFARISCGVLFAAASVPAFAASDITLNVPMAFPESLTSTANGTIYIRGDRANSWGTMMEILGAVGGAGYTKVGLVSSPSDKQAQRKK